MATKVPQRFAQFSSSAGCSPLHLVTVALFDESADQFRTGPKTLTLWASFVSVSLCFHVASQKKEKQGEWPSISYKVLSSRDQRLWCWTSPGTRLSCGDTKREHDKGVSSLWVCCCLFFFYVYRLPSCCLTVLSLWPSGKVWTAVGRYSKAINKWKLSFKL